MTRYIDIDKAEEDFFNIRCEGGCECYPDGCDSCLIYEGAEFFIGYETEDVQPVVHAKVTDYYCCSNCKYSFDFENMFEINYCPNCGAKLK